MAAPLQQYQDLCAEGHDALARGEPVVAIARFTGALRVASGQNLPIPMRHAAKGWTELARGVHRMQAADPATAASLFETAAPLLEEGGQDEGVLRARAFASLARAQHNPDAATPAELVGRYRAAVTALKAAQEHHPRDTAWAALVLSTSVELRAWEATSALLDGDAIAAAMSVNQLRTVVEHTLDAAPPADARRPAWHTLAPTLNGLRILLDERVAFRALNLARAENLAATAIPEIGPPLAGLAELALASIRALRALQDGRATLAGRHLAEAERHARALARPTQDPRWARFGPWIAERRALLDSLRAMLSGRSHPLFERVLHLDGPIGEQLRGDLVELEGAYTVGAWRLTLVGAGAVLESVLLHLLRLDGDEPPRLAELVELAVGAGLLSARNRYVSDALREYHPLGRVRALVDRDVAQAALDSVLAVFEEFGLLRAP